MKIPEYTGANDRRDLAAARTFSRRAARFRDKSAYPFCRILSQAISRKRLPIGLTKLYCMQERQTRSKPDLYTLRTPSDSLCAITSNITISLPIVQDLFECICFSLSFDVN